MKLQTISSYGGEEPQSMSPEDRSRAASYFLADRLERIGDRGLAEEVRKAAQKRYEEGARARSEALTAQIWEEYHEEMDRNGTP